MTTGGPTPKWGGHQQVAGRRYDGGGGTGVRGGVGSRAQEGPGEAGWLLWPSGLMTWTLEETACLRPDT